MALLESLESAELNARVKLSDVLDALPYNDQGLVAAIAQDATSKAVLMLGWMDRTAIERTLTEGNVWYFSRSRQSYWRKGESSGHTQTLRALHIDCDGDALLLSVEQTGPACHTNRPSCFYLTVDGDDIVISQSPV